MEYSKRNYINRVRRPLHGFGGWLFVAEFSSFFWRKHFYEEGPHISYKSTGSGMQARCHRKIIEYKPGKKPDDQQPHPGNRKWQPKDKQKIDIRDYQAVQVRYFIQYIHLYENECYKP